MFLKERWDLYKCLFSLFCSSWWVPRRWWRSSPRHWLSPECSRPDCQEGSQGTQPSFFSSLRHGSGRGACQSLPERTHSTFWAFRASPGARPGASPAGRHPGEEEETLRAEGYWTGLHLRAAVQVVHVNPDSCWEAATDSFWPGDRPVQDWQGQVTRKTFHLNNHYNAGKFSSIFHIMTCHFYTL